MVYLTKISKHELPELIKLSYEGDDELLEKFHLKKMTLSNAVKCELELINEADRELELRYFKVIFEDKPIGYVVKSGKFLYSFAISVKYRKKEILEKWWDALKTVLGDKFTCGLMSNNTRAIAYMKARGMKVIFENPEHKEVNEILLSN